MRTQRTRIVLGHVLAAAMLALTACGGNSEDSGGSGSADDPSPGEQPSAGQPGSEPDLDDIPDVVAEVNGEAVPRDEFVAAYEAQLQQASMQAQSGGEPPDEAALKEETAESLVDIVLLRQEAEKRGISVSDQQTDDELDALAEQNQLGSAQDFLDALEAQGTSEDQVRTQVETQVTIEGLVDDEAGDLEPTERQLRTLYRQVKQQQAQAGEQGAEQQPVPPYQEVKPQLEEQALAQQQSQVAQQLVSELREDADITINL